MDPRPWIVGTTLVLLACGDPPLRSEADLRPSAERFFNGVFGCDPALIEAVGAEEVVVSYPIFESLFGTSSIRGREAVLRFSAGFCSRWSRPVITIHEVLQDGDRVVLVWEFSATPSAAVSTPRSTVSESWGGISFFRFDADGRVIEELGEESTPGPVARLGS